MTTHKETIDVPDGWTIETFYGPDAGIIHKLTTIEMAVILKPIEPLIKPCPFCGMQVILEGGDRFWTAHARGNSDCPVNFSHKHYPTRLAAIEAANRRAT